MLKNLYILLTTVFLLFLLTACNNSDDEKLLGEEGKEESNFNITFGEKVNDTEVQARNLFTIGETPYFVVNAKETQTAEDIKIQLSKNEGEDWEVLTEAPYDLQGEWKQFMNGLPAQTFEQLGSGAYRLTVLEGDEELVSGDFVFEEQEEE
ncbi:hypothetical protein [Aquibacillus sediminis]|uniref:hypothetical protein n=1 Tax=Aquibacillus sediminis TaxID=2574734 RepID=UPI0011094234|nr:hypothetical protein [Aquibacillus sediminis]